jgi:hypothetical protein
MRDVGAVDVIVPGADGEDELGVLAQVLVEVGDEISCAAGDDPRIDVELLHRPDDEQGVGDVGDGEEEVRLGCLELVDQGGGVGELGGIWLGHDHLESGLLGPVDESLGR